MVLSNPGLIQGVGQGKEPERIRAFANGTTSVLNSLLLKGDILRLGPDEFEIPGATGGTVTSVSLTMPSIFAVAGSPVTTTGGFTVTLQTETANRVFAGPTSGGAATPTFRALVTADFPLSGVTAGSYTNASITVDGTGRITAASSGSSATGTVTSVSVATANGVSGSVATPTTTPAITITLGAITPSSVNGNTITTGTGTLTLSTFTVTAAANATISGTNTGDQTITLTGDVTGAGTGSFAATIAAGVVTLAKIANAAANSKLLGSGASGSGASYVEITLGTGLTMTGTTLSASGGSGNSNIANHSLCGGI